MVYIVLIILEFSIHSVLSISLRTEYKGLWEAGMQDKLLTTKIWETNTWKKWQFYSISSFIVSIFNWGGDNQNHLRRKKKKVLRHTIHWRQQKSQGGKNKKCLNMKRFSVTLIKIMTQNSSYRRWYLNVWKQTLWNGYINY